MVKMKIKKCLLILISLTFFVQCGSNKKERFELAEKKLKEKWDRESYLEFMDAGIYYSDFGYLDYLPYSYIMANRFNDGRACNDIASGIIALYSRYNLKLDSTATSQVIFYLEKGANLGDDKCKDFLYYLFTRGGTPRTKLLEVDSVRANRYKKIPDEISRDTTKCKDN